MRWIARVFVFAATLVFGTLAASLFWFSEPTYIFALPVPVKPTELNPTGTSRGIKVMYAGWERGLNRKQPYLKFVVHNGQYMPVSYAAHSPENPFAQMKANGEDIDHPWRCGTGMRNFHILPGGSAEFHVGRYEFLERPNVADQITAGFYLDGPFDEESKIYYSEPFQLPDAFRASLPR